MAKPPRNPSGRGYRDLTVKVKTARGRTLSSKLWLERQLNDPYVVRARAEGFRGRAAFKIMELDDRFGFLVPGARVVDLGCAPGGWLQVAAPRINADGSRAGKPRGRLIGVDLQEVDPVPGAEIHVLDFLGDGADDAIRGWLGGPADVVMSDMAAASSGHRQTDHLRIIALCEAAAELAFDVLSPGGTFVAFCRQSQEPDREFRMQQQIHQMVTQGYLHLQSIVGTQRHCGEQRRARIEADATGVGGVAGPHQLQAGHALGIARLQQIWITTAELAGQGISQGKELMNKAITV